MATAHKRGLYAVAVHSVLIVLAAAAFLVGLYRPSGMYKGEFFLPYAMASGPLVWLAALFSARWLVTAIWDGMAPSPAVSLVLIPGILHLVLGGLQWYILVRAAVWVWAWFAPDGSSRRGG